MNNSLRGTWYKYTHYKKLYWPLNLIVFNLLKLITKRDSNLWVFGALGGNLYEDNTKYLFEFVNNNARDQIRAVWLTRNEEQVSEVRDLGYEAYTFWSPEGRRVALKAGVAFYTHGLQDFGKLPLIGGAKIICLWHGFSFKKIYNYNYSGVKLFIKTHIDSLFSWTYRDYSMVTSDYTKKQFMIEFNIKDEQKIYITGQPRNDIFKKNISKESVFGSNVYDTKKIILFLPTYRSKGQDENTLKTIVNSLVENKSLNDFLIENNSIFMIKLHPQTPSFDIINNPNFVLLRYDEVKGNQELLAIGDVLLTDYSGCFVDYALLNRPIIFYTPDEEEYISYSGKLESDFYLVSSLCKAYNVDDLIYLLNNPNLDVSKETNRFFEDPRIKNTFYSRNVYNKVIEILRYCD